MFIVDESSEVLNLSHIFSVGLSSSGVVEKLKNLLPALISCFQDFSPLVHTMPQIDTQSYDCMLLILQNIDLLVGFFIDESGKKSQQDLRHEPPYHHTHVNISDQRISLLTLKKLWDEFPFNPIHDLSKKVLFPIENKNSFCLYFILEKGDNKKRKIFVRDVGK